MSTACLGLSTLSPHIMNLQHHCSSDFSARFAYRAQCTCIARRKKQISGRIKASSVVEVFHCCRRALQEGAAHLVLL